MNLSEEQIKNILQHTQLKLESQLSLEDTVIGEINNLKQYDQHIENSKRKARISLYVSLGIVICLIISLLYNLIFTSTPQANRLQNMLPTFMVIVVLFMLHQLLYFSQNIENKIEA